jgi:hypothetical protein
VQVAHLNPIAERITKIAAETFYRLQPVFFGDLFAHFRELLFVPHHDAKMPHSVRLDLLDLEHCQELMLAELEKGITFALCQFLEIEGSW